MQELPYRDAAGVMLLNNDGKVFVGQRLDSTLEAWQMPQGGLDPGEGAQDGAMRELQEETGISRELVEVLAQAEKPLFYDLPADLVSKLWRGRYRGQRQAWFLCRFLGNHEDIDLQTEHPEFRAWKWVDPDELPRLIVPFKVKLYEDILQAFRKYLNV